jgi:putative ABC transport system substrate-binding protein
MKRREFLAFLSSGAAASVPFAALAQQAAMPVIGFLHSASLEPNAKRLAGFRKGLQQAGFIEGQNVTIEFRWTAGQNERLLRVFARHRVIIKKMARRLGISDAEVVRRALDAFAS